jgi:hypothetical protein
MLKRNLILLGNFILISVKLGWFGKAIEHPQGRKSSDEGLCKTFDPKIFS